jgi:hypothetical protein
VGGGCSEIGGAERVGGEIDNDSGQRIEDEVMMDSGFRFWEAFGSWASFTTFILDILYHVCKYQWNILNQASCPFREIFTCIVGYQVSLVGIAL